MTATAEVASPRWSDKYLWIAFVGASIIYALPSMWLLANYLQPAFDLAIYDQSLWLLAHGKTFNTIIASNVFGVHFSPILVVLSPLSLLPGGATPEIVFQSLLLASGVFPAAGLARCFNKSSGWFVAAFFLHPAIIGGSWYGFRPWNLAVAVFLWFLWWIVTSPTTTRIVVSGLILLAFREDMALWIGLAAIVLAIAGHIPWSKLIVPGLLLGASTALILFAVIPSLSPVDGYFFASSADSGFPAPGTAAASILVRVAFVVLPFGVIPSRIAWKLALPLAIPLTGLLLTGGNSLSTAFHYDMMFVPVMLIVIGLSPRAQSSPKVVSLAALGVLLLFGALRPFPPQDGPNPFRHDSNVTRQFDGALAKISTIKGHDSLSIAAPSNLLPHLSKRSNVFIYPEPVARPETDQYKGRLELQCPNPNIVVTIAEPKEPWKMLLRSSYHLFATIEKVSIWKLDETAPDEPCTAVPAKNS